MGEVQGFLDRWSGSAGSERANAQPFLTDLCDLLGVPRPATGGPGFDDYRFEKPIEIPHPDGKVSTDRIDFHKKGCFVLEAKQAQTPDAAGPGVRRGTPAWQALMERAYAQARNYAVNLAERLAFKSASQATVRRHLDMLERIGFLVGYDDERGRRWHAQG